MASWELTLLQYLVLGLNFMVFSWPPSWNHSPPHTHPLLRPQWFMRKITHVSCVILAQSEGSKVRPNTFPRKFHWFINHIKNGDLKVVEIDSSLNWAHIVTKPFSKVKHKAYINSLWDGNVPISSLSLLLVTRGSLVNIWENVTQSCEFLGTKLALGHEGALGNTENWFSAKVPLGPQDPT